MFTARRPDGTRVTKAPKVRLFMPHLMPRRNDSLVFFEHQVELTHTLDYLARWNAEPERPPLTFFQIFIAAGVRVMHERPRLNRFVAGRRLYQRNSVDAAISVIKARHDDAKLTVVKLSFEGTEGLRVIRERVNAVISDGRSPVETASEKEVSLISRLPRWAIPLLVKLQKFGDYFNILPPSLIANDPLYSSFMVSHLGSIGVDSAFHHLYEHGTLPIFATIGKIQPAVVVGEDGAPAVRTCVTLRYTFDERIADGFYAARALERMQDYMQHPWKLEIAADAGPGQPEGFVRKRKRAWQMA
jgi:hypothetical protein